MTGNQVNPTLHTELRKLARIPLDPALPALDQQRIEKWNSVADGTEVIVLMVVREHEPEATPDHHPPARPRRCDIYLRDGMVLYILPLKCFTTEYFQDITPRG